MDDSEIIALFFARDEKAISASLEKFGAYCKTIARNILKNEEETAECVNAVFQKAWESIPPKNPPVSSSFFGKLTKNHALNLLKSSGRAKRGGGSTDLVFEELEECISDRFSVESELERKELIKAINKFLFKCSDTNRKAFVLRYWYCADISYIAGYLGISETTGNILAHPKPFSCLFAGTIVQIKTSRQPITEEFFHSECEFNCRRMSTWKNTINTEKHGSPDPDGMHHITANTEDEVKAVESGIIIYTGTDSDGSGMVVVLNESLGDEHSVFIVYKGLDTTFPKYYVETNVQMPDFYVENYHKMAVAGEPIGYVGDSGDAYWFVLDNLEFEKFAEENGINFYPMHN